MPSAVSTSDPDLDARRRQVRMVFVGQTTFFGCCSLDGGSGWIDGAFVDFREGTLADGLAARIADLEPDVVLVFKPEIVPAGVFEGLDAVTLGYLTEPVPRRGSSMAHADLERRLLNLSAIDAENYDRIISFDPHLDIAERLGLAIWRAMPLPVADRYFRDPHTPPNISRPIFIGRSTEHRERMLIDSKHHFDLLHIAHGVGPDTLAEVLDRADVGINIHNCEYPNFENRAALHLAAGHLLISEELSPSYGLEAGLDYVLVREPSDLVSILRKLREAPDVFRRTRLRGRAKAELFRASTVYARLVASLAQDLAAFGTDREGKHVARLHEALSGTPASVGAVL